MNLHKIGLSFTVACCGVVFSGYCQEIPADPIIEYEKSADVLVIRTLSFSGYSASGPSILRIFGNGRVLVQRNRESGRQYSECYLSQQELDELLRFMSNHGTMTYPYDIIKQRLKEEAERRRAADRDGRVEHGPGGVADGTTMIIEIFLERFRPGGSDQPVETNFHHKTGGYAINIIARMIPELKEAQDLGAVVKKLWELHRDQRQKPLSASEMEAAKQIKEPPFPDPPGNLSAP